MLTIQQIVLYHTVLPKVREVWMKAMPWSSRLMLSWIVPESHKCKDMHTVKVAPRIMPQLLVRQAKIQSISLGCKSLKVLGAVLEPHLLAVAW